MDADLTTRWFALGPIRWGIDDCVPIVANELATWSGVDPLASWRGPDGRMPYRSERERDEYLAGRSMTRLLLRAFAEMSFNRVPVEGAPEMAVGLAWVGPGWAPGLSLGNGWWIYRGEVGATVLSWEMVTRSWIWQPEN